MSASVSAAAAVVYMFVLYFCGADSTAMMLASFGAGMVVADWYEDVWPSRRAAG